jgi:hypothetical protein
MGSEPERSFYLGRIYLARSNRHIRVVATSPTGSGEPTLLII